MPNCTRTLGFFHPYFACPFCRFSILVFLSFSFIFSTPSWKWRPTLFVLELRHLFLWSSGHLAKKKGQIVEEVWTMTKQVVKSKDLRGKTKERMAVFFFFFFFFTKWVRNIFKKAVGICVIIPQNRKLREFQLHIIDQSFSNTMVSW